jgi:lysophospholipase L1-like esterase
MQCAKAFSNLFEQIVWSMRPISRNNRSATMIRAIVPFALVLISISGLHAQPTATAKPTTTVAVTQDRDKAIYDWQKRHTEVIELGKKGTVDVVMLGDSILHYWAGEPKAPIVRGQDSWDELFQGKTVANLGFGWDRVENVLWRVQNGELTELKPKIVVLMIGTNNLEWNNAKDIRIGIQALCAAIHTAAPEAQLHVLGVLPRTLQEKLLAKPHEINAQLHHHLSGKDKVHFHDLSEAFLDAEGQLQSKLFSDGLHPNQQGYSLLAKSLRQVIAR